MAEVTATSILDRYGKPVLIAFGAYLIGALVLDFITMSMFGAKQGSPLIDISGRLSQTGGGSGVKLLVLLSFVSIGLPLVWPDKKAWLALLVPLLAVLWAFWSVRQSMGPMKELMSYGIGFYVTVLAGLYLAATAVKRARAG
jgi:hypothetical protein